MAITNTLATTMLGAIKTGSTTYYLALFVGNPTTGTEVSGNAYARVAITDSEMTVSDNTLTINAQQNFPEPTGTGWGTPDYWGVMSASTGGTLLWYNDSAFSISEIVADTDVRALMNALVLTIPLS